MSRSSAVLLPIVVFPTQLTPVRNIRICILLLLLDSVRTSQVRRAVKRHLHLLVRRFLFFGEVIGVDFLDLIGAYSGDPDVVVNHHLGKGLTVDENHLGFNS